MGAALMGAALAVAAPALQLQHLTLAYGSEPAVLDLSGEFAPGSLTAVVGPNGAGKSTLLAALAGELRPVAGSVIFQAEPAGGVAWLPQRPAIDRSFPMRTLDLVAMGLWRQLGGLRPPDARQRRAVFDALEEAGAAAFAQRPLAGLSVGQFQRLLFARVILQDAAVILLDEPFAAIDAQTTIELMALIVRWHAQGRTVVAVLHDLDLVRAHFPSALLLVRRCIAWGDTASVLTPRNLALASRAAARSEAPHDGSFVEREVA